jgi:hypothetical protein
MMLSYALADGHPPAQWIIGVQAEKLLCGHLFFVLPRSAISLSSYSLIRSSIGVALPQI